MFRNYLDKIERDEDVRKNLIELRKLLKTEPGSAAWHGFPYRGTQPQTGRSP